MPRRLRLTTLPHRARRLRRHAVRHFHRTVTLCILGALLLALAVYGLVQHRNTEGAVDVVVGSSLMARLSLPEAGESVPVLEGDTPDTLAARVLTVEHEILPESVRLFCAGKLGVDGRHVHVL